MSLRGAAYRYQQAISSEAAGTLAGYNCDVFQIMLDVESGYTDIATLEGEAANEPVTVYPDRIAADAPVFSYALYDDKPVKTFSLGQFLDNGATGEVGTVTVFGYCFSKRSDARVVFYDGAGTCHYTGRTTTCAGVP
jgi:hypothetical protein